MASIMELLTPNQLLDGNLPNRNKISNEELFSRNLISNEEQFSRNRDSDSQEDDSSGDESKYSLYSDSDSDWLDTEVQDAFSERPKFDFSALNNRVQNQKKFNDEINDKIQSKVSKHKNTRKFLKITLKNNYLYVILGPSGPFHSNLEDDINFYGECIIDGNITDIFYNIIKYDNYLENDIKKFDVVFPGCKDFGNRIIQKCKEKCCAEDQERFTRALLARIITPLF